MRAKLIFVLAAAMVLFAGCTDSGSGSVSARKGIDFSVKAGDLSIAPGDSADIKLTITNNYDNELKNVEVNLEPLITGMDYHVSGPSSINPNETKRWDVLITTSPGLYERTYSLYPTVCFDYIQTERGYFRVADGNPTQSVDFSSSDVGPLRINIAGLKSANINNDDEIDVKVSFSSNNGITNAYSMYNLSDIKLKKAEFRLDNANEVLKLKTYEGTTGNKMNNDPETHYCLPQSDGTSLCYFVESAGYDASDDFDFTIELPDSISSEIMSMFSVRLTYRYCFKGSSLINVNVEGK